MALSAREWHMKQTFSKPCICKHRIDSISCNKKPSFPRKELFDLKNILCIQLIHPFSVNFVPIPHFDTVMPNVVSCTLPAGIAASISDTPPVHYTVKIQAFSLLAKHAVDKYESGVFEAGGYKWKLVLYPNGNKSKNVKEHISLYLAIADTSSFPLGWEIHAVFRLFLLDQNKDNYLIFQDAAEKEKRFYGLKLEWGFDQLLQLTTFNEASNGFLVEDTCVFGAEVFVCKERSTGKGECLSMLKLPTSSKYAWKIENFSKLDAECKESQIFSFGDQKWKIHLYPKGKGLGTGTHLSLYLALADPTTLPPASKVYVDFTLRILDQVKERQIDHFGKVNYWFSPSSWACGWARFISLNYLYQPNNNFLVKDICMVEAEVTVLGIANAF